MSLKIAIIVGSTRPSRVGHKIADWTLKNLPVDPEITYELIDLKDENLPFLDETDLPASGNYQNESSKRWSKKISAYDGYIWVTSEYNHGYSASLKNAIDSLYHEWAKKPVAFVGYGAMGGVRAIEQLAQVAAQLGMAPISGNGNTIKIIDVWSAVDGDNNVTPEYVRGSFETLGNELKWWGEALKTARG